MISCSDINSVKDKTVLRAVSKLNENYDHSTYLSRFTWRYGSKEMRNIFSEKEYRLIWREIWYRIAEAQSSFGLVTQEELSDIFQHKEQVNIERSHEIERRTKHDLVAELEAFAEECPKGGGKIHLGATSADIEENADMIRIRKASAIILERLLDCLKASKEIIIRYADTPCIGWTHLQPAEPITLGYRFANYAQDIVLDIGNMQWVIDNYLLGKGIRGAVGTSASYSTLLEGKGKPSELEKQIMEKLQLNAYPVSTQTYPRKADFLILTCLASIAQSAHKFAFDIRILQSPVFGELSEPHDDSQVGSSAMPHKQNPIHCERICSLGRYVMSLSHNAWINAANTLMERTLDDSANRHIVIADAFLATDEILKLYKNIQAKIAVNQKNLEKNLATFSHFVAMEPLLMKLVGKGASRIVMHEKIRLYSQQAWKEVSKGETNHLVDLLLNDKEIALYLDTKEIINCFDVTKYVGDAGEKSRKFVKERIEPLMV